MNFYYKFFNLKSAFLKTVRQELSYALCPGDVYMYDWSFLAMAQGVGRGFTPELDPIVDEAGNVNFSSILLLF